jgi:hypothetical protein
LDERAKPMAGQRLRPTSRAALKFWKVVPDADVRLEKPPDLISNESLESINAAGTGVVPLIKADATDSTVVAGGRAVFNVVAKTIVDGSATSLFDVALANDSYCGGTIFATIFASDGTDHQAMQVTVNYAAVDKAGTKTLAITDLATTDAKAVSSGTLTLSWTFVTGTGKATVKLQPTGSLTETTYTVFYTVLPNVGAVTIL